MDSTQLFQFMGTLVQQVSEMSQIVSSLMSEVLRLRDQNVQLASDDQADSETIARLSASLAENQVASQQATAQLGQLTTTLQSQITAAKELLHGPSVHPVINPPVSEAPVQEAPAVEAPVEEAPAVEAPVEEAPAVEAPVEEAPAVETDLIGLTGPGA